MRDTYPVVLVPNPQPDDQGQPFCVIRDHDAETIWVWRDAPPDRVRQGFEAIGVNCPWAVVSEFQSYFQYQPPGVV